MNQAQWNPEQYLKFKRERTQPSIDLVNRINYDSPLYIADIGCGPGNSTEILRKKWSSARVTGVDLSAEMIDQAKKSYPDQKWEHSDALSWKPDHPYDIIFSNAMLQWVENQKNVLFHLMDLLVEGGVFAVQVPQNYESALHQAVLEVAELPQFTQYTKNCKNIISYYDEYFYYELLAPLSKTIDMWTTTYCHILQGHCDLVEWYKGSGMKLYLDQLPNTALIHEFEQAVLDRCKSAYSQQSDGTILFGFKRLFFTIYKK